MKYFSIISILIIISGCGDPPLLSTPLPNGYEYRSNGGLFGYITNPNGVRLSNHFGILNDKTEAWCEEFSWQSEMVICERDEYPIASSNIRSTNYFILNTKNGHIDMVNKERADEIWRQRFGNSPPKMKSRHSETKSI